MSDLTDRARVFAAEDTTYEDEAELILELADRIEVLEAVAKAAREVNDHACYAPTEKAYIAEAGPYRRMVMALAALDGCGCACDDCKGEGCCYKGE